jgi:hypothetical protein
MAVFALPFTSSKVKELATVLRFESMHEATSRSASEGSSANVH